MKGRTKTIAVIAVLSLVGLITAGVTSAKKAGLQDPWVGIYTQTIDKDLQDAFDLDRAEGVVIVEVVEGSPADDAGLSRGDIIISFDGQPVDGSKPLREFVDQTAVGDEIEITFIRNGKEKTATVEVGRRPKDDRLGTGSWAPRVFSQGRVFSTLSSGYVGVSVQDLTKQLGEYFGVEAGEGVLVTEVMEDSPAEKAGVKAGDIIVSADGEQIAESRDLQEIISEKSEGDEVTLTLIRRGEKLDVRVEVAEDTSGLRAFSWPNANFQMPNIPRLRGLDNFFFSDDDRDYFDVSEYKEAMQEYRESMDEMKKEMKRLEKELQELKAKLE